MEVTWFFLSKRGFFLYYFSFSFVDDIATFFKEGVAGKRIIFFIA
jgi:hypothetical protein